MLLAVLLSSLANVTCRRKIKSDKVFFIKYKLMAYVETGGSFLAALS